MKRKLLITGASGFLGYHLLRLASKDWEVYGLYNSRVFDFTEAIPVKCDITNYIELGNLIDDIEPDAVIHTAAIADAAFCQQNKELSYRTNVEASDNLAGICSDFQIPFAFTSTDMVFDGKKGMYKEDDPKNPLSVYGEQKSKAEEEVLKIYPGATVFRLPLMFGYLDASAVNYTAKLITELKKGESITLFNDEFRSVGSAKNIGEGILTLFENKTGIIHLAGPERLSRYDFGMKVVRVFGLPAKLVHSRSQKEMQTGAPRPADVSLNIDKAVSLGFSPARADEELLLIKEQTYF